MTNDSARNSVAALIDGKAARRARTVISISMLLRDEFDVAVMID
jgi:hypothetical protein